MLMSVCWKCCGICIATLQHSLKFLQMRIGRCNKYVYGRVQISILLEVVCVEISKFLEIVCWSSLETSILLEVLAYHHWKLPCFCEFGS